MKKQVYFDEEFLEADGMIPVEGTATDVTKPSVFDIPRSVALSDGPGGELLLRFVYVDSEPPTETEAPLETASDVLVTRGRHSGKLMSLRVRGGAAAVPAVSARIRALAPVQKRKNQELNFLLLSNILDKKRAELLA